MTTLKKFAQFIVGIDPNAQHYENTGTGPNYTVWQETRRVNLFGDGDRYDGWQIIVDRWTETEFDTIAEALETAIADAPNMLYTYSVNYDVTGHRIHHVFTVRVL